jgi:hypothetical protein
MFGCAGDKRMMPLFVSIAFLRDEDRMNEGFGKGTGLGAIYRPDGICHIRILREAIACMVDGGRSRFPRHIPLYIDITFNNTRKNTRPQSILPRIGCWRPLVAHGMLPLYLMTGRSYVGRSFFFFTQHNHQRGEYYRRYQNASLLSSLPLYHRAKTKTSPLF